MFIYLFVDLLTDDDTDRAVKDGPIAATGACCQEAGQILGVWCRSTVTTHGYFRSDSSLARLHLVRNR